MVLQEFYNLIKADRTLEFCSTDELRALEELLSITNSNDSAALRLRRPWMDHDCENVQEGQRDLDLRRPTARAADPANAVVNPLR